MEPQIQRWSAKRKVELLLSLIKGERKLVDVCREHDLKQSEVESWMETFVKAGERGLKAKSDDEAAVHEKELKDLRAKVGELGLELDARKQMGSSQRPGRDGIRMSTAVVRRKSKHPVNRKKVHRIIKLNGWQVWRKPQGKRPRAQGWTSRASKPNERWAVDATHVFCGRDGWCHRTAIIDCWDRNIVGWQLSKTGVAKIAAATLEDALRSRKIDPTANELTLRSDNGLVFGAKPFVKVVRRYGLDQEYITPYTPEQNGMIERSFGTLKSECVWQHRFQDRDHAFGVIARWLDR